MSFWTKIGSLFSGERGVVSQLGDVVDRFVHTPEEKAAAKVELLKLQHQFAMEAQRISLEQDAEFNQRIKDLEGTGKDLLQAGWVGRLMLFLRGAQRPLWGYGVLLFDVMVFSGRWDITGNPQQESALWVINVLVLGFLFGERSLKNVLPYFEKMRKT